MAEDEAAGVLSSASTTMNDNNNRHDDPTTDESLAVSSSSSSKRATVVLAAPPPPLPLDWTQGASLFCPEAAAAANRNNNNNNKDEVVIRYPWDVVMANGHYNNNDDDNDDWLRHETQVTIVGTAGQKITHMGQDLHAHLSPSVTHLVLRSHLIRTMEGGIHTLANLQVLELYDNQIDELNFFNTTAAAANDDETNDNEQQQQYQPSSPMSQLDLGNSSSGMYYQNLKILDISYNVIRDMEPLVCCINLQELCKHKFIAAVVVDACCCLIMHLNIVFSFSLYKLLKYIDIAQNKIKSISGIRKLTQLKKIDLGANRIRVIPEEELLNLTLLEELWLGKNKIEHISGLAGLISLRRLDVQSNRLTSITGLLDTPIVSTLEELYLSHNAITDEGAISGLLSSSSSSNNNNDDTTTPSPFTMLTTLDLSRNRLTSTKPFAKLTTLVDLWISGNDIKTFNDIDELRLLTKLDSIYLEYNPLDKEFDYRKRLAEMIPSLTQIDANKIGGNGWGGYSGGVFDLTERMRLMQDAAIERAKKMETSERSTD